MYRNLYIHVPFCTKKCDYCAFYSESGINKSSRSAWLEATLRAIADNAEQLQNLNTIYFGGGTPTLLDCRSLEKLFNAIKQNTKIIPSGEISIEANPETLTSEKASLLSSFANRITIGAQSFSGKHLAAIGRNCRDPEVIVSAIEMCRKASFKNIGADLIYAIPGQTTGDFINDMEIATDLGITHLSCYSLTFEEGAMLGVPDEYDTESADEMWFACGDFLASKGFPRYEVSNYAIPSFESRHNCNVWHGESYLGIGPSASSFDGKDRFTQQPSLEAWLNGAEAEYDIISPEKRSREIFAMGLRTVRGWERIEFENATGFAVDTFDKEISFLRDRGFMELSEPFRLTEEGLAMWNDAALELI